MAISQATRANWRRLQSNSAEKLQHGANKSRSRKRIYPKEYLLNKANIAFADKVSNIAASRNISREKMIFSLACSLLEKEDLLNKKHVQQVLSDFYESIDKEIFELDIPLDEWDILGFVYQCLLSEGEKNIAGSYYTPANTAQKMAEAYTSESSELVLDPCCGSGSFLLAANVKSPDQLWGCDKDMIAVFIARVNLLIKYKNFEFVPHIYCCDYLRENKNELFARKYALVITNPPWGAEHKVHGKKISGGTEDTFSLFFKKSMTQLKENGKCCFLLPEAVLNIKTHKKIRAFMLHECTLESIEYFSAEFSGVMTGYVIVKTANAHPAGAFTIKRGDKERQVKVCNFSPCADYRITFVDEKDEVLLKKIRSHKKYDLSGSIFALGIVTGDNKNKLYNAMKKGCEAIYTGKEVDRYIMRKPEKFLHYDRTEFQQAAKDEYYRSGEKLVYKFISSDLVFAYDNSRTLLLNSANMLIPHIPDLSIKTVLALLNSEVLRYYYKLQFGDVKILKGNLIQLPLPAVGQKEQCLIEKLTDKLLAGDKSKEEDLQKMIYACYNMSFDEIREIKGRLHENIAAQ